MAGESTSDENRGRVQRVLNTRELLMERGIHSSNIFFSKNEFSEVLKGKDSYFNSQDHSTVLKWINVSLGFVGSTMEEAMDLFVEIANQGKGKGMVWELVERAGFMQMSCGQKIMTMKVMVGRHLYKVNLAAKLRAAAKSKSRADLPPGAGPQDKITRWFGEECKELLSHMSRLHELLVVKLMKENIPTSLLTRGELTFDNRTTTDGLSGITSFLYEDIPGPKSLRTPKFPSFRHERILMEFIDDYCTNNNDVPSAEEVQQEDGDHQEDEEGTSEENGNESGKVTSSGKPKGALVENYVSGAAEGSESDYTCNPECSEIAPVQPQPITRKSKRNIARSKSAEEANSGRLLRSSRLPAKKPRKEVPRILVSDVLGTDNSDEDSNKSPETSNLQENDSEVILDSGHADITPPHPPGAPNNTAVPVNHQVAALCASTTPPTKTGNVAQEQDRPRKVQKRRLHDIDESSHGEEEEEEELVGNNVDTLIGEVMRNYEVAVEDLIQQDPNDCLPKKLERMDETISREEMSEEIFPPAIAPNSFARRVSVKTVKNIQKALNHFVQETLRRREISSGAELCFGDFGDENSRILYFREKKLELEERGFTLFESILKGDPKSFTLQPDILFEYMEKNFRENPFSTSKRIDRRGERMRERDASKLWVPIFNDKSIGREDRTPPAKRRFQTWPWKIREGLPMDIRKRKASIDILAGFLVQGLYPPSRERDSRIRHFSFPDYGSIFLRTCEDTTSQMPHCDFPPVEPNGLLPFHQPPPLHNMFIMYSGKQPFAIRIWRTSHSEMNVKTDDPASLLPIAKSMKSKLEIIPQYSILIGRGDLVHAGASGKELKMAFTNYKGTTEEQRSNADLVFLDCDGLKYNTRGHMYATRGDYTFDGVFRTPPDFPTRINDDNIPSP